MAGQVMFRATAFLGFLLAINTQQFLGVPPPSYRIAGIVVDSITGQPLEGAEVTIAPVTALDEAQTFLTSASGRFLRQFGCGQVSPDGQSSRLRHSGLPST